jgi:tol-pal system protein YbgF
MPAEPADETEVRFEGAAQSGDAAHVRPQLRASGKTKPSERAEGTRPANAAGTLEDGSSSAKHESLGVAPAPAIAVAKGERRPPEAEPLKLYRAAYDDLMAGRRDEAARSFREFVRRFPHHDYADNAQYWLAESLYAQHRYADAAPEFRAVVSRYPSGNKAPDALLKLGYCLLAGGEPVKGRELLGQVGAAYPRSEAARLAQRRLAELDAQPGARP